MAEGIKWTPIRSSNKGGFDQKNGSGWWFQPLWKIWKSVGSIIPNIWKIKKCLKPPTSLSDHQIESFHLVPVPKSWGCGSIECVANRGWTPCSYHPQKGHPGHRISVLHGLQHAELNGELRVLTLIQLPDQRLQHPQGRPLAGGSTNGEGDAVAAYGGTWGDRCESWCGHFNVNSFWRVLVNHIDLFRSLEVSKVRPCNNAGCPTSSKGKKVFTRLIGTPWNQQHFLRLQVGLKDSAAFKVEWIKPNQHRNVSKFSIYHHLPGSPSHLLQRRKSADGLYFAAVAPQVSGNIALQPGSTLETEGLRDVWGSLRVESSWRVLRLPDLFHFCGGWLICSAWGFGGWMVIKRWMTLP